jgi:beta-galactosidase
LELTYSVPVAGRLNVAMSMTRDDLDSLLPRFGVTFGLDQAYAEAEFYGRGRVENQWDRKSGTPLEFNRVALGDLAYDYVRPQESGARTDNRWLELSGESVPTLRFEADPQFDFSIWPHTAKTLENADHTTDLTPAGFWTVQIDKRQMGVGGDNSWHPKAMPLPPYRLESFGKQLDFELEF